MIYKKGERHELYKKIVFNWFYMWCYWKHNFFVCRWTHRAIILVAKVSSRG